MKLSSVVIEPDDLAEVPSVTVEPRSWQIAWVRWDTVPARPARLSLHRGESAHIAVTAKGCTRIRAALGVAGAEPDFVGESGGRAICPLAEAVAVALAVKAALLQPGSLSLEIHGPSLQERRYVPVQVCAEILHAVALWRAEAEELKLRDIAQRIEDQWPEVAEKITTKHVQALMVLSELVNPDEELPALPVADVVEPVEVGDGD